MARTAVIFPDWGLFLTLALPTTPILPLLPPGFAPERREDGLATLALNLVHFQAGGEDVSLPETFEVDIGLAVPADNGGYQGQPQAKGAMHVLSIAATAPAYREICRDAGYRLYEDENLTFDLEPGARAGCIGDARGEILRFAWTVPAPPTRPFRRVGQDAVHDHRGPYRLTYVLEGEEWPDLDPATLTVTTGAHPFFLGLPITGQTLAVDHVGALPWGPRARMTFYGPEGVSADQTPI